MYVSEIELCMRWWNGLSDFDQEEYKKTIIHPVTGEIKSYIETEDILLLWNQLKE